MKPFNFIQIIFLVCFLIIYTKCQESVMSWREMSESSMRHEFYLTEDLSTHIRTDASVKHQVTIKITNKLVFKAPKITFSCTVRTLSPKYEITDAFFCWRTPTDGHEDCQSFKQRSKFEFANGVGFQATLDKLNGVNITTEWESLFSDFSRKRPDVSGLYWCKFSNPHGHLLSTTFDIQDVMMVFQDMLYKSNTQLEVATHKQIGNDDLPLTLNCPGAGVNKLLNNYPTNIDSIIDWKFCTFSAPSDANSKITIQQCQRQVMDSIAHELDNIIHSYIIHPNGSLTIFKINQHQRFDRNCLVCFEKIQKHKYYGVVGAELSTSNDLKMLVFDGLKPFQGEPKALSPSTQTIEISEGQNSVPLTLTALYRADYTKVRATWSHNANTVPGRGTSAIYQYELGKRITREDAGQYRLSIGYGVRDSIFDFYFTVKVTYPPKQTKDFDPVDYIIEGGDHQTSVFFDNTDTVTVAINGANLDNGMRMQSEWQRLAQQMSLNDLKFEITPLPLNAKSVITYKITNMTLGTTHSLSFKAENRYGRLLLNKLIYVVPKPVFSKIPNSNNCTDDKCLATQSHEFKCALKEENYQNIIRTGAKVEMSWYLGKIQITEDNRQNYRELFYFEIKDKETLLLRPIIDPQNWVNSVLTKLSDTKIECVVEIFDPQNYDPKNVNAPRLYSSRSTTDHVYLTASLQLRAPPPPVSDASITWIVAIILAILLLLIIGGLIIYILLKDREGATYLVDEQERATGNDPEKEIKEKEAFHSYERGEDDHLNYEGSRFSLDDNSVGIHSDSGEEDVEMYDLDTTKFNEDGSFIYKYGQSGNRRPRGNGSVPLPPPPIGSTNSAI